jgi:PAS domain S-box-containing protein
MQRITNTLPIPAIIVDKEFTILHININGLKFFGEPFHFFHFKNISSIFPNLDTSNIYGYKEVGLIFHNKNGIKQLLQLTIDIYNKKIGNIVIYITLSPDRKESNFTSLRADYFKKKLNVFETFINKLNEGILVFNSDGDLQYLNDRASKKFKISYRKLKKYTAWELVDYFASPSEWGKTIVKSQKNGKVQFTIKKEESLLDVRLHHHTIDNINYYMLIYSDISEEVKNKHIIEEKESQIDIFHKNIPAAIFQLVVNQNNETYINYISDSFESIFGFNLAIQDTNWHQDLSIHPEDIVNFFTVMFSTIESHTEFKYVGRLITNNRITWCEINALPVEKNGILVYNGIIQDITTRKEFEIDNKRKSAFNDSVLHNIPADIAVFDKNHTYLFINNKGIANDEIRNWMIGKNDFDYCALRNLDTSMAQQRRNYFNQAKDTKKQVDWIDEIDRNGKKVFVLRRFFPFYVDDIMEYMIGYGIDITELKTTQLNLIETQKINDLILKSSLDAIIMIDTEFKITFWNEQAEEIFGWKSEEVLDQNLISILFSNTDTTSLDITSLIHLKGKKTEPILKSSEFIANTKKGKTFPIELVIANIDESENKMDYCIFIRDISNKRNSELEIKKQNKALIKQNKELEQFNYIASHDLQEPLLTLVGYSNLLEEEYGEHLDEEGKLFLRFINKSAIRMRSLITGLLQYTRINKTEDFEKIDVNEVINEVIEMLHEKVNTTNAKITVEKMPLLNCSSIYLSSLFQNLISNALKFKNKVSNPEIKISCEERKDDWLFIVNDNGIGIDEKKLNEVFIMFRRLHNQDDYTGYGIGLAHCKKIVEIHNGEIWVESKIGEGSTFYFTIAKKI